MKTLEQLLLEHRMHPDSAPEEPDTSLDGLLEAVTELFWEDAIVAEIGSHMGVSTELFAMHCHKVYTIDCWASCGDKYDGSTSESRGLRRRAKIYNGVDRARYEKICRERLSNYSNVEIIKDFSENAVNKFEDEFFDIIYIDGNHTYEAVAKDIELWSPKIKRGGFVLGHDFNWPGVKKAVEEAAGGEFLFLYKDTSWGYQKK
jgi:predicted O-methyltransferase YrrM